MQKASEDILRTDNYVRCAERNTLENGECVQLCVFLGVCVVVGFISCEGHSKHRNHNGLKQRRQAEEDKDFQVDWKDDELATRVEAAGSKIICTERTWVVVVRV